MNNPYELAKNILQQDKDKSDISPAADGFTSIGLYGASVHEKSEDDGSSSCFHLENESGTGDITLYRVFPGMELVYNDMHMAYCNKQQEPASDVMEINYCREGRSECLFVWRASVLLYVCRRSVFLFPAGQFAPVGIPDQPLPRYYRYH